MLEIDDFRERIEKRLGRILNIAPIEKGFSFEKKFKLTIGQGNYVVRLAPFKSLVSKTLEFELMSKLCENGVQCNNPIVMFKNEEQESVCSVFSYLPGFDAEDCIAKIPTEIQYKIGVDAGRDLKRINGLSRETNDWKKRKWKKHEYCVRRYLDQSYRFKNDKKVMQFIETHYDKSESDRDYQQHDDFHLGNIIINERRYGGVIDFNNCDWGDPLHEFVKLEWITWPVSNTFAHGQIEGYFGKRHIDEVDCNQISVYIAMSILSTIVWTIEFHPHTWENIEPRIQSILDHFDYFESIRPKWAT